MDYSSHCECFKSSLCCAGQLTGNVQLYSNLLQPIMLGLPVPLWHLWAQS